MSSRDFEGFRLSPQQRQLWLLAQSPSGLEFQTLGAVLVEGSLDPNRLRSCLETLVDRHEALRTRFARRRGSRTPLQVIVPSLPGTLSVRDGEPATVEELFRAALGERFDLENGPVLRVSLRRLSPDRHRLLLELPALCADSRSLDLIVHELSRLYAGESESAEVAQYADLAEAQNELLESDETAAESGRTYWREQTQLLPPPAELPFESVGEAGVVRRPGFDWHDLGSEMAGSVQSAAEELGVSPAALLLSVWGTLLGRLTSAPELMIAVSVPGRNFEELETAVGLFARSLPVRYRFEEEMPFRDRAHETDRALREAEDWQDYVMWPGAPERAGTALESSFGFSWERWSAPDSSQGVALSIERKYTAIDPGKLHLACVQSGDSLLAECRYDGRTYRPSDVERLMGHFAVLLESAVREPDSPAGQLSLLSESDRQWLVTLNRTDAESRGVPIHELFEEQAMRTPQSVALVFGEEELTYGDLNARANQVSHRLMRAGAGPNVAVGLCTERSAQTVVGLLGILKAGAAYVPLNPEHPPERLLRQLVDSDSRLLLTQSPFEERLGGFPGETLVLDRFDEVFGNEPSGNPDSTAQAEDLCYVIYTSGSTGTPKGVAVRHRNLVNYVDFILRLLRTRQSGKGGLRFALVSSIAADLGNTTLFASLASGGTLHVLSAETASDGRLLGPYCSRHRIDVMKIAPSHLESLLISSDEPFVLPRRVLILGGEAFSWKLFDRFASLPGECEVINHYGPTETTVGSLTFPVNRGEESGRISRTVPLGRPISNTQIYVLDSRREPVPVGVPGELYIGGAGLAAGYLNRPEETREKFVANPRAPEELLYRTGDLVRYLPDGNVEYLGRTDHQVKIRGFRVELQEVEATILRHPAVGQCIVIAAGEGVQRQLTAYVVPLTGRSATGDEVRGFARESLPDFMVPSRIVFLRSLPLTGSGKVDRMALADPERFRPEVRADFAPPRNRTEEKVGKVWGELLKLDRVGIHDDFFDLGGHSLLVTQVVSRLRREFRIELPLRSVFECPTVAALAAEIDRRQQADEGRLMKSIESLSEEEAQALLAADAPERAEKAEL